MESVLVAQRGQARAEADERRRQLLESGPGWRGGAAGAAGAADAAGGGAGSAGGTAGGGAAGVHSAACVCGETMGALHERGEKLQTLQTSMASMASEAETLYDTARKIRERSEHNSKWLPF